MRHVVAHNAGCSPPDKNSVLLFIAAAFGAVAGCDEQGTYAVLQLLLVVVYVAAVDCGCIIYCSSCWQ